MVWPNSHRPQSSSPEHNVGLITPKQLQAKLESSLSHFRHMTIDYRRALRSKQEHNELIENDLQANILRLCLQTRLQDTV